MHSINQQLANIFEEIALILDMDEIPFKPRAYEKAAESIRGLSENIGTIYQKEGIKGLEDIPGVGKNMAEKIEEFLQTKEIQYYKELKRKMPVDITGLAAIEGIGPKMIRMLYKKLGITNISELKEAAKAGKIARIPSLKEKTQENILRGIEFLQTEGDRKILAYVSAFGKDIIQRLQKIRGVTDAAVVASARRMQETVGDLDFLVASDRPHAVIEAFTSLPEVVSVYTRGSEKASVRLNIGIDGDLLVVPSKRYGAAMQYFTGDKAHNVHLRTIAIEKGMKLNEYGLFRGTKCIAKDSEQEIYEALGLSYVEPELRTDTGEIETAASHTLPHLIPYGSLKGDLQVQTNWTDGTASIAEMADAAIHAGLTYIAITDHTKSLTITGGLDEGRLARQGKEIDRLNRQLKGKIILLKSAEINIVRDGTLDISDAALKKLDIVSVAVHSHFKMNREEMTRRIITALAHPLVHILFHPTGRLINKRKPYEVDMDAVIAAAKKHCVALELDSFPDRMDLKDVYVRKAIQAGVRIVIDSDAHAPEHFQFLHFGIGTARRGWVTKKDVLNTQSLSEFRKSIKK